MTDYQRIRRQQALREAEGYLDLTVGFSDRTPLPSPLRVRLAERALEALHRVPNSSDQRAQVLYLTGQAYRAMYRYREAILPLEKSARLDPENLMIWLALGWCYKRVGRLDLAIQAMENGLDADPQEAILHYNLACYWSLAGSATQALRCLSQSLEIDPQFRLLVGDESDFDPIRDLPEFQTMTAVIV